jgi:hypothetical protein
MEALMNRGGGCVVPALVYLFNLVEKMFDGSLTLLVLDEAWLFFKNETFAGKIAEWLKVLRKKNVFVVFATQDVADVEKSPLKSTVIQQCLTKIYLADPSAATAAMIDVYRAFGLTDAEIGLISAARMKQDYFYTSPLGRRLFRLDLGPLTLALIGTADHDSLDKILAQKGQGFPLCTDILESRGIGWRRFRGPGAPSLPEPRQGVPPAPAPPLPPEIPEAPARPFPGAFSRAAGLLDAVKDIPERKKKDGSGRAAALIAEQFAVSQATVYQARSLVKNGGPELLEAVREGGISIKAAYRGLPRKREQGRIEDGLPVV